jgi:hypothetical protein
MYFNLPWMGSSSALEIVISWKVVTKSVILSKEEWNVRKNSNSTYSFHCHSRACKSHGGFRVSLSTFWFKC